MTDRPSVAADVAATHDHEACIEEALEHADRVCASAGTRLTELRRRVLEQVWASHEAVKAYDLLERLSNEDHTAKPPTVYRVLQFLQEQGLVHRLECLNAYVGCPNPQESHDSQFLICRRCGVVREINVPEAAEALATGASEAGFTVERQTVELLGHCHACQAA